MNIIIVGGGRKVHFLSKSFISKGYNVTIVNDDADYCKKLARLHRAIIVNGDGTKPYILEDAGAAYAQMVIALTPKDQDNLVICQISEKMFKVKRTFAVVNDPENISIFGQLGVDTVISTTNIISSLIEQRVSADDITNITPIEEGKIAIVEIEIKEDYPVVNKKLRDIDLPKDSIVGCIMRNGQPIVPRGDTSILSNDKVIVLSLPAVQSDLIELIRGKVE